jgi:hypothetical protein
LLSIVPPDEGDEEKHAKNVRRLYRFIVSSLSDAILGATPAVFEEGVKKYLANQWQAKLKERKEKRNPLMLHAWGAPVSADLSVVPFGINKDELPFIGGAEPMIDYGRTMYAGGTAMWSLIRQTSERTGYTPEGARVMDEMDVARAMAYLLRSGDVLKTEMAIEKAVKAKYKSKGGGQHSSSESSGKGFGGSSFGGSFGGKGFQ